MTISEENKRKLKELVIKDLSRAFESLKEILKDNSSSLNQLLVLEGQYRYITKRHLHGTVTNEEARVRINAITHSILEFIDNLAKEQPKSIEKAQIRKIKFRKGKTLYNVPNVMKQGLESRCFVRVAFTETLLKEGLQSDATVKIQEIKVADTMQVELLDPSSRKNFEIRHLTSSEQTLEEDSYTEWQFMVTPLQVGEHELILKIALIENIDGKEKRKEITLIEQVNVLVSGSESILPSNEPKELQEIALLISSFVSLPEKDKALFRVLLDRVISQNPQKGLVTILLLCIGVTGSIWAVGYYQQEKLWNWADAQDSIGAYEKYTEEYPNGRHREDAIWKLALLHNTLDKYLAYIQSYPDGKFIEEANYRIALLQNNLVAFYQYLDQFPKGANREEVFEKINFLYRQSPPNLELSVGNDTLQVNISGAYSPYFFTVTQSDTTFSEQIIRGDSALLYPLASFRTHPGNFYFSLRDSVDNLVIDTLTVSEDKQIEFIEKQSAIRFLTDSVHIGQVFKGEVITVELPYENISNTAVDFKKITLTNPSRGFRVEWRKNKLSPGQQGTITVRINTESLKAGQFSAQFSAQLGRSRYWKSLEPFYISGWVKTTITDLRDKNTYPITKINGKIWYAENVRFDYDHYRDLEEFFSCNKTRDRGDKTFRWEDARRQACPDGWRIPTEMDWESVFRNYGEFDIHTTDTTRTAYNEIVRAGSSKLNISTDIKYWTDKRIEGDLVSVISLNSNRTQIRVSSENKKNCYYCRCLKVESNRTIRIE